MSFSTAIRSELCLISVLGDFISTINRKSRIVSFFGAIQMFGFKIRLISVRFARICITVGLVCSALACDSTHLLKSPTAKSDVVTDIVSGISRALADQRSKLLSDIRYQVSLNLPANKLMGITGHSVIKFKWKADRTDFLVLDFKDPRANVESLKLNGAEVSWEPRFDHILIKEEELRDGFNEISIGYLVGSGGLNRDDNFLYTLFVPDRAHFSIPVFDQPDLKATVKWSVEAPNNWTVITNGTMVTRDKKNSTVFWEFAETRPISTYLFSLAAGEFFEEKEMVNGREFRFFHRDGDTEKVKTNQSELIRLHAQALEWMEEYTGIDYPFQKFDFVLVPDFQYGGMEHPGSIFYRDSRLMLDPSATQNQLLSRAAVIAHETAHMWFGDLVTMRWFDDVWTKEVFANFFSAKIIEPSFTEIDHELRFLTEHYPSAYRIDRSRGANPISQPLSNLKFAGSLYGPIIYQKAPIVMRHLEMRIGSEQLRQGLIQYLERYSFGNASWSNLINILEENSGENLKSWNHDWVEQAGLPIISVRRTNRWVKLTQKDPLEKGRTWEQLLTVAYGKMEKNQISTTSTVINMDDETHKIDDLGDIDFVIPNGSGFEYGQFLLDTESQNFLLENVNLVDDNLLRGAAWISLWEQVLQNRLNPDRFFSRLLHGIEVEKDELLLETLQGFLQECFVRYLDVSSQLQVLPGLEALLWSKANNVAGGLSKTARASFYLNYRMLASTEAGKQKLFELWSKKVEVKSLPLSELDQISLSMRLAVLDPDNSEFILKAQAKLIKNKDRKARFNFLLPALSSNAAVRAEFVDSLRDYSNREREAWVIAGLSYVHHPSRAIESVAHISSGLNLLTEIQRTGDIFFPTQWLNAIFDGHNSSVALEIALDFLSENPSLPAGLLDKIEQAIDPLRRSVAISMSN